MKNAWASKHLSLYPALCERLVHKFWMCVSFLLYQEQDAEYIAKLNSESIAKSSFWI